MPEVNQMNVWADNARNRRREAQQSTGWPRLRAAEDGLTSARQIAAEAGRYQADREGRRNLRTLLKELEELRDRGLRETAHQLAAIITDPSGPAERQAAARRSLRQLLERYAVAPTKLGLNGSLLNEP